MSFFNDRVFHFEKFLTKLNAKIRSNKILILISWHSYVLKKYNVPWLSWFQMTKKLKFL